MRNPSLVLLSSAACHSLVECLLSEPISLQRSVLMSRSHADEGNAERSARWRRCPADTLKFVNRFDVAGRRAEHACRLRPAVDLHDIFRVQWRRTNCVVRRAPRHSLADRRDEDGGQFWNSGRRGRCWTRLDCFAVAGARSPSMTGPARESAMRDAWGMTGSLSP